MNGTGGYINMYGDIWMVFEAIYSNMLPCFMVELEVIPTSWEAI